ncbi:hypothetical protein [Amaricoccus macauensis]|uniref:hypothetical protein n=1 Tax=Amaricoccus macauensis TaxID=57001 RepID=UPI003C7BD5CB
MSISYSERMKRKRVAVWKSLIRRQALLTSPRTCPFGTMMADQHLRLHRQLRAIARDIPASRRIINPLIHGRLRKARLPIACVLIFGGLLAVLPVFGLWMLPIGLLLLALDVPRLRPIVSATLIRTRRRITVWRHRGTRN